MENKDDKKTDKELFDEVMDDLIDDLINQAQTVVEAEFDEEYENADVLNQALLESIMVHAEYFNYKFGMDEAACQEILLNDVKFIIERLRETFND